MRMNRLIPLVLAILLLAAAPSAYAARGFSLGVAAGVEQQHGEAPRGHHSAPLLLCPPEK